MVSAGRHRVPRSALATLPWLVALFSLHAGAVAWALPGDAAARARAVEACVRRLGPESFRPDTDAFVATRVDHARGLWCVAVEQRWNALPVVGVDLKVTLDESGRVVFEAGSPQAGLRPSAGPLLGARAVTTLAARAAARAADAPSACEPVISLRDGGARHAWRVTWSDLAPPRPRTLVLDAATGEVLAREGEPMPSVGLVYPRDGRDALQEVALPGLSGDGTRLVGPRLDVLQAGLGQLTNPAGDFRIVPTDPDTTRFDDVAAWWRAQQFLAWLWTRGYSGFPDTLHVRVHAPTAPTLANTVDNYVMLGEAFPGYTRDPAKGTDILVHETQHAVSWGFGLRHGGAEVDALNEGLSDYMAAAMTNDPVIGEWEYVGFPGGATTVANDPAVYRYGRFNFVAYGAATAGTTWANGMIFSGALWDLRSAAGATADSLVLEALRMVNATPCFADFANATLAADTLLHGRRHVAEIHAAFGRREIVGTSDASLVGLGVVNGGQPATYSVTGGVLSTPSGTRWTVRHERSGVPVDSLVDVATGAAFTWSDTVDFVVVARVPTVWAGSRVSLLRRVVVSPTMATIVGAGMRFAGQPDTLSLLPDPRIVPDSTTWSVLRSCGSGCSRLDPLGPGLSVVLADTVSYQVLVRTRSIWGEPLASQFNVAVVPVPLGATGPARLNGTEPGTFRVPPNPNLAGPPVWSVGPACGAGGCPEPESLGTGTVFVHAADASFRTRVSARTLWGHTASAELQTTVVPIALAVSGPANLAPGQLGTFTAAYDPRFVTAGPTWWIQRRRDGAAYGTRDSIGRGWTMRHADTLDYVATAVARTSWGSDLADTVAVLVQTPLVAIRGPGWFDGAANPLRFTLEIGMPGRWTVIWGIYPVPRTGSGNRFHGADTLEWTGTGTFDIGVTVIDSAGHLGNSERRVWRPSLGLVVPDAAPADVPVNLVAYPDTLFADMQASWEVAPDGPGGPQGWSEAAVGFTWSTASARDRWVRASVRGRDGYRIVSDARLLTIAPPQVSVRPFAGVPGAGLA